MADSQRTGPWAEYRSDLVERRSARWLRLLIHCGAVMTPAWLFAGFEYTSLDITPDDSGVGETLLGSGFALITVMLSLGPSIQSTLGTVGLDHPLGESEEDPSQQPSSRPRPSMTWRPAERALLSAFGAGSVVSIMLNSAAGKSATDSLFVALFVLTSGNAILQLTRAASQPSVLGMSRRRAAQKVLDATDAATATARDTSRQLPDSDVLTAAEAEVGRQDIAEGFRTYGDANESAARVFLLLGVVLFAGSVAAGLWLVDQLDADANVASILARLSVSVPGAVTFGVFVREASARRRYGMWGRLIAIQAEHLRAFTADMDASDRREVEMQFARSVFSGGDVALDQDGHWTLRRGAADSKGPRALFDAAAAPLAVAEQAVAIAKSVTDLAKAQQPRSEPTDDGDGAPA